MSIEELLNNNRHWAAAELEEDPEFFARLAQLQAPDYLWIGCSDSRVPANEIVGLRPGDVFVHRNVANLVVHSDLNCLSVLQYAVDVLQVKHVIVCGHYGCGGVQAALSRDTHGLIDNWLLHLRDTYKMNQRYFDALSDEHDQLNKLCELNVLTQAYNVGATTIVQDAWQRKQPLEVHAWVYAISDGLIRDLGMTLRSMDDYRSIQLADIAQNQLQPITPA